MTLPTNAPLPIGSGERLSGDVPIKSKLNQVSPLIPSVLEHLPESQVTMGEANWGGRYDQTSILAQYDTAPLEFFEPIVHRVFNRPPRASNTILSHEFLD